MTSASLMSEEKEMQGVFGFMKVGGKWEVRVRNVEVWWEIEICGNKFSGIWL